MTKRQATQLLHDIWGQGISATMSQLADINRAAMDGTGELQVSYQTERDAFLVVMANHGLPLAVSRDLLRHATRLHHLAEAQCNGAWPFENGSGRFTEPCSVCMTSCDPRQLKGKAKECPDCRVSARVRSILPKNWTAVFQGDPRGCVLRVKWPDYKERGWAEDGYGVPTR